MGNELGHHLNNNIDGDINTSRNNTSLYKYLNGNIGNGGILDADFTLSEINNAVKTLKLINLSVTIK